MRQGARALILCGLLASANAAGAFTLDLQKLGDALQKTVDAFSGLSESQEVEIGQGISAKLLGAAPLVADDEVQAYVNQVGRWIALQSERPDLPWTFAVIESNSYNAFAAPGGYVFITRGLFSLLRTEAELAGVLAHEIAHVVERHHLSAIQASARRSLAADALSELAASQSQALRSNQKLFGALVDSGMSLYASGLDREDEYESDRIGVVLAARAGYEPFGLPGLLLALEGLASDDSRLSLLNATHPSVRERIERLDALMSDRLDKYADQGQVAERFMKIRGNLDK